MRILSALFETALLPASLVKDVCTLGGTLTGKDRSSTRESIQAIERYLGMMG